MAIKQMTEHIDKWTFPVKIEIKKYIYYYIHKLLEIIKFDKNFIYNSILKFKFLP